MGRGQIPGTVGVRDRHHDHLGDLGGAHELDHATRRVKIRIPVEQVENRIALCPLFIRSRQVDPVRPLFTQDRRVEREPPADCDGIILRDGNRGQQAQE